MGSQEKKKKKPLLNRICLAAFFVIFFCCSGIRTAAADEPAIIGTRLSGEDEYVYIKGLGDSEPEFDTVQIGAGQCEDYGIIGDDIQIRTLILFDNSDSTGNNWGNEAKDFLCELIGQHAENEEFKIVTYEKEMTELSAYSRDYVALENVARGIEYKRQDSYLRDVLYRILEEIDKSGDSCFYRLVIIADGVDQNEYSYTETEVMEKLKESGVPVYALGVATANNNKELESFFSYSRKSNGQYWIVGRGTDRSPILSQLDTERQLQCLKITPPRSQRDGSAKALRILLQDGTELQATLRMPFASGEEPAEEPVEEPSPTITPVPEEKPEPTAAPKEKKVKEEKESPNTAVYVILAVIATVSVAAIVFLIVYLMKKKKRESEERDRWTYLSEEESGAKKEDQTVLIPHAQAGGRVFHDPAAPQPPMCFVILTDLGEPSRVFRAGIRENITIGRKEPADIVLDFDLAVSGRHCMITLRAGRYFLRDLGSSNKTFYNGEQVVNEKEIENGGTLSIGKKKYRITMEG